MKYISIFFYVEISLCIIAELNKLKQYYIIGRLATNFMPILLLKLFFVIWLFSQFTKCELLNYFHQTFITMLMPSMNYVQVIFDSNYLKMKEKQDKDNFIYFIIYIL